MEEPLQNKSRNISFTEFENDTTQNCETAVDSIPRWNYDILRIIFQYLPAKDLQNAAKVCRSWLEAARKEKQTRKHLEYIMHVARSSEVKLDSVWIEPSIGFHFITIPRMRPYRRRAYINRLINYRTLPRNYNSIIFEVDAVVLENNIRNEGGTKTVSRHYRRSVSYILCAYLPQIPNIHIDIFVTNNLTYRSDMVSTEKALKKFVANLMTDTTSKQNLSHENSLCFMLFSSARHLVSKVFSTIRERCKNKRVSIWGGCVNDISCDQPNMYLHITVVAIFGLMRSWSVVVNTRWKAKQVENRLTIFKDQVKLKKYSIGFVFAGNARGKYLPKFDTNEESIIFKKVFPQVSLVGCGGDFVFGMDTDPISDEQGKHSSCMRNSAILRLLIPLQPY